MGLERAPSFDGRIMRKLIDYIKSFKVHCPKCREELRYQMEQQRAVDKKRREVLK